jgi:hypothetical protein
MSFKNHPLYSPSRLRRICAVFLHRIIPAEVVGVSEIRSAGIWLLSAGSGTSFIRAKYTDSHIAL